MTQRFRGGDISGSARRLAWLLAVVLSLAACSNAAGGPPTQPPAVQPTTGGGAVDGPTPPPGGTGAAPLSWQVEVVQNGQTLDSSTGEVALARVPFTLRVILPEPLPVKLNANDTDANFQAVQPGFSLAGECMVALCTGMDVAEERLNPMQALFVDSLSTHYLYYEGPDDHRWSRASQTDAGWVFERDVALLNDAPVEQYTAPALYVMLLANASNPDVIDPGELKKITLAFN